MAEADFSLPPTVDIRITAVVARDYERRGVFPALRLERALKVINGATGVYRVSLDEAREIYGDAQERRRTRDLPRGVPVAFSALASYLATAIRAEQRRGLCDDPGYDEATKRVQDENPARFKVGEAAMLRDGRIVEIVKEYKLWRVRTDDGIYVDEEGDRISYKFGYVARAPGGEPIFYPSHYLFEPNGSVRYLKLVA